MPRYRLLDHTADMAAYFYGDTRKEVFVNAAISLMEIMVDRPPKTGSETLEIKLKSDDIEDLLIQWLGELIYLFQEKWQVVTKVALHTLSPAELHAAVNLAPFHLDEHGLKTEIKAATYHQVEFKRAHDRWRAKVVFDL